MFSIRAEYYTRLFIYMEIRPARKSDISSIIELIREFAEYEKLTDYFHITEERLSRALFEPNAFVRCLVIETEGSIAGYSIFYPNFSSFRGQTGIYLEDIYITPAHRAKGIGEKLLREIAKIASEAGFERIDFQVLAWNTPAVEFYLKLGAVRDDDERHFKFTDSAFANLAK